MNKLFVKILIVLTLIAGLAIAAFYWNEARKEIEFLCDNFDQGVSEQSVRSQLDTGNLLRYHFEYFPTGKRITVDSPYNLYQYECIIDFDGSDKVMDARFE